VDPGADLEDSMSRTGVYRGDGVLAALEALDGEAQTDEIAAEAGISSVEALVTLGNLGSKNFVVLCETGNKRANPRWRLPQFGEEGFQG
jgi:hypothetical protein